MCHLTGKSEPVAPSEDECKAVVGEPAPDFELESDLGGKARLSDLRGKKVVLYFYPKDNTSGCTMQAVNFQRQHKEPHQFQKQTGAQIPAAERR